MCKQLDKKFPHLKLKQEKEQQHEQQQLKVFPLVTVIKSVIRYSILSWLTNAVKNVFVELIAKAS